MWPLIYLSLLNVGFGFLAALVVYCRVRYVRRQLERGYDLIRLSPPSMLRSLLRRFGIRVQVEKVCIRLGETPPLAQSSNSSLAVLSGTDTPSGDVQIEVDGSKNETGYATNLSNPAEQQDRDAKTLDPLDRPDVTARDLVPRPEQEPREVRYLERLAAKSGGELTSISPTTRINAEVTELSSNSESTSRIVVDSLSEQMPTKSNNVALEETMAAETKEVAVLADSNPARFAVVTELKSNNREAPIQRPSSSEDRKKFAASAAGEGDFLQRAARIDRMLRAVMDEHDPDPESTLLEVIAEVQGTHQWWTEFEGSVSKALKTKAPACTPREQRAQIDDDLVAMQASLVECHNLIESTITGKDARQKSTNSRNLAAPGFSREMHGFMIQAAKTCHHLRDNLALMISESPFRFSESSENQFAGGPPLAYVSKIGVEGVDAVVSQWEVETAQETSAVASLVLVDIDRTEHWNNELGLESVDRILTVCHQQLAESVRSNRGFDRVIRISGQQFLVFLGSTDCKQARFAAERLRQIFSNTTWRESGQALVIHVSAAVSSYDANQPIGSQISDLRAGLPEAKRLGGNAVVEQIPGGRFQKINGVPQYQLPARHHDQPLEKWKPNASVTC